MPCRSCLALNFAIQKKMKLYVGCDGLTGNESRNHGAQIQWQMKFLGWYA